MGRNTLKLDFKAFEKMVTQLEKLGGNVKGAVNDALTQTAETIREDTIDALNRQYLPARGAYSHDVTIKSVVENTTVEWSGSVASVGVGFDYSKPGAGGFLITGTPRMQPDYALEKIYVQKKYMKLLANGIDDILMDYIEDAF